jgi:hypothetical protein
MFHQARSFVNEARVELHQRGARANLLVRGLRRVHPADADNGHRAIGEAIEVAHQRRRAPRDRRPAEPPGTNLVESFVRGAEAGAVRCGVGRDEAVYAVGLGDGHGVVEGAVVDEAVGLRRAELDEDRQLGAIHPLALGEDRLQERVERVGFLEGPAAEGVGAGNVERDVVGVRGEAVEALAVVLDRIVARKRFAAGRRGRRLGDVDAQRGGGLCPGVFEAAGYRIGPFIAQSQTVDQRAVLLEAKGTRPGVALRRARRHRADLRESEAQRLPETHQLGVFVEARRQPDGAFEVEPPDRAVERGILEAKQRLDGLGTQALHPARRAGREAVRLLGPHLKKKRAQEAVHRRKRYIVSVGVCEGGGMGVLVEQAGLRPEPPPLPHIPSPTTSPA